MMLSSNFLGMGVFTRLLMGTFLITGATSSVLLLYIGWFIPGFQGAMWLVVGIFLMGVMLAFGLIDRKNPWGLI